MTCLRPDLAASTSYVKHGCKCPRCYGYYRDNHLKRTYGISLDEYNRMHEEQDHRCAICRRHQADHQKSLHVDHDHETGEVRGLLCYPCNRAIAILGDSAESVQRAVDYLT